MGRISGVLVDCWYSGIASAFNFPPVKLKLEDKHLKTREQEVTESRP